MRVSSAGVVSVDLKGLEATKDDRRGARSAMLFPAVLTTAFIATAVWSLLVVTLSDASLQVGSAAVVFSIISAVATFVSAAQAHRVRRLRLAESVFVVSLVLWLVFGIAGTAFCVIMRALGIGTPG